MWNQVGSTSSMNAEANFTAVAFLLTNMVAIAASRAPPCKSNKGGK